MNVKAAIMRSKLRRPKERVFDLARGFTGDDDEVIFFFDIQKLSVQIDLKESAFRQAIQTLVDEGFLIRVHRSSPGIRPSFRLNGTPGGSLSTERQAASCLGDRMPSDTLNRMSGDSEQNVRRQRTECHATHSELKEPKEPNNPTRIGGNLEQASGRAEEQEKTAADVSPVFQPALPEPTGKSAALLLEIFAAAHQEKYGDRPYLNGTGKRKAAELLGQIELAEAEGIFRAYFSDPDEYLKKERHPLALIQERGRIGIYKERIQKIKQREEDNMDHAEFLTEDERKSYDEALAKKRLYGSALRFFDLASQEKFFGQNDPGVAEISKLRRNLNVDFGRPAETLDRAEMTSNYSEASNACRTLELRAKAKYEEAKKRGTGATTSPAKPEKERADIHA